MKESTKAEIAHRLETGGQLDTITGLLFISPLELERERESRFELHVSGKLHAVFVGLDAAAGWVKARSGTLGAITTDQGRRCREVLYFALPDEGAER